MYPSKFVKDCTGLLTQEAVEWFESRGLMHLVENSLDKPEISDLVYVAYDGTDLEEIHRKDGYLTNANRVKLDLNLRELAGKMGAESYDGHIVETCPAKRGFVLLTDKGDAFRSTIVVEATGAYSAIVKSLGVVRPCIKAFGVQHYFTIRSGENVRENYFIYDLTGRIPYVVWVTPKNDEIVIGGPVPPELNMEDITSLAIRVINEYGYNIGKSSLKLRKTYYSVATVPVSLESFIYFVPNRFTPNSSYVIVTGEAGRFVTPRNVNGIPYALWSGSFAAKYIYEPKKYQEVVQEKLVKILCSKIEQAKEMYGESMEVYLWP